MFPFGKALSPIEIRELTSGYSNFRNLLYEELCEHIVSPRFLPVTGFTRIGS